MKNSFSLKVKTIKFAFVFNTLYMMIFCHDITTFFKDSSDPSGQSLIPSFTRDA